MKPMDPQMTTTAASTSPESHLGTMWPLIRELQKHQQPRLAYHRCRGMSLIEWKETARKQLTASLNYSPPPCDLNVEVVERVQKEGYERRYIRFSSATYSRIPAYLLVPNNRPGPLPGVLALHDHSGFFNFGKEKLVEIEEPHPSLTEFKERSYSGRSLADELAKRGYVVLVIDAFFWGERRMQFEHPCDELKKEIAGLSPEDPVYVARVNRFLGSRRTGALNSMLEFSGTNWLGIMVHDDRTSLDLLAGLPEVDEDRIGVLGLSVGGYRTTYLVGADPRVKAACIVGWMTTLGTCPQIDHPVHVALPVAGGLHSYLDHPDVATLGAPDCALYVLNCARDQLFTFEGMWAAVEKIESVYEDLGDFERFKCQFFDVPHQFNAEMQDEAFAWLGRWL